MESYGGSSSRAVSSVVSTVSEIDPVLLHRDLAIATEVQRASFPKQPPVIPGLNCASFYKPAHNIGGDYYDFLALPDGAWGFAIGDVSGKGIGAALLMAGLQGSLRTQILHSGFDIETLITNVNRLVWESYPHFRHLPRPAQLLLLSGQRFTEGRTNHEGAVINAQEVVEAAKPSGQVHGAKVTSW